MMFEWLLACVIVIILYSVYRFAYAPYQVLKRCGIKGPTPMPFFGNYREEVKMSALKYCHHLQQEYGPVVGFYVGQTPKILITDLEMLKQIMVKDYTNFMDHEDVFASLLPRNSPRGLLLTRGETWKTNRQILSPTFSTSKMKLMVPLIRRSVEGLVKLFGEKVKTGESFEVFRMYGSFTMETILATAFGRLINVQEGESDELTKAAYNQFRMFEEGKATSPRALSVLLSNFPWLTSVLPHLFANSKRRQNFNKVRNIALELIKSRKESGAKYKDLLQLMIDATGEEDEEQDCENDKGDPSKCPVNTKAGKFSNEQVVILAIGFLMAGYETTANCLAYTSYLLALNPEIQEKLQAEIDNYFDENPDASHYEACQELTYLDNVIQESLRIYPPAPITDRVCLKTTNVKGYVIPEGASIVIPSFLLHKDPLYWPDPEKFDPDRFTQEERAKRPQMCHLPFGFGPRSCIGMRFALLEAKMALLETLKKYTFVRTPDTEVPLQTILGITMSPKNGIYLKVIERC